MPKVEKKIIQKHCRHTKKKTMNHQLVREIIINEGHTRNLKRTINTIKNTESREQEEERQINETILIRDLKERI